MSLFQSYLITGPSNDSIREKTTKLARQHNIDLSKSSPDIFFIKPVKNSIIIDQIRELKTHIFQKPLKEKFKFIVIEEADTAKAEAQNALLKILEEPPTHAIIALESKNATGLLPTITSRVVIIRAKQEVKPTGSLPKDESLDVALAKISEIDNPKQFLDDQMIALAEKLVRDTSGVDSDSAEVSKFSRSDLISVIEKHKEAKQMIAQNVNPTFVLTNLIISTNRHM